MLLQVLLFATHRAHLHDPQEVLALLDGVARTQVEGVLVLTGERPEVNAEVAERLASHGHADFTSYVVWVCERALERGLLPHTNLGVLAREDLARLREVTASQGLMLESVSERLMETVHAGSRRSTRRGACARSRMRVSFGSPSRAGSSWASGSRRTSGWPRCRRWPRCMPATDICRR